MKTKAHTRYRNANNKVIPGTTTITGQLDKPHLVKWANDLGLLGIDSSKFRDDKAEIGTLAHAMIMHYLLGTTCDTSDYSANQINQAENSCLSFYEWLKYHKIEPVAIETQFISEKYQYGGTVDLLCYCDGVLTLIDFKTGSGIYEEHWYQVAGYLILVKEHRYDPLKVMILNIPRNEDESFDCQTRSASDISNSTSVFLTLRTLYTLRKNKR